MTTILELVVAMGVDPADLQDTDEYFEVVQSLIVGNLGDPVKDNADLINPGNNLGPTDLIQIRRLIGTLGADVDPLPAAITADDPVLYIPETATFNGAQDKVAHASLGLDGPFATEAWIRCTGPGTVGSGLYSTICGAASPLRRLMIQSSGGIIRAEMGGTAIATAAGTAPRDTDLQVVYVFDGAAQRVYINGVQRASGTATSGPSLATMFWEGAYASSSGSYSFKGTQRHRAFFNHALSAARVLAHYNAGVA